MSHGTTIATEAPATPKCWFCHLNDMPSAVYCSRCFAVGIPSKDGRGTRLEWTVFSFVNDAPEFSRSTASIFQDALDAFDKRNGVAIRVANGSDKYMLVRHPQCDMESGYLLPAFSVKEGSNDLATKDWHDVSPREKQSFRACLNGHQNGGKVDESPGYSELIVRVLRLRESVAWLWMTLLGVRGFFRTTDS